MKVFEIVSEYGDENGKTIREIQYVTHDNDDISYVTKFYKNDREQLGMHLIGVGEKLDIVRHLTGD
jgi:hypothetical protein